MLIDALLLSSVLALMEYELALQTDKMTNEVTKRKIHMLEQYEYYIIEVNNSQQRGYENQHPHDGAK